MPIYEYRCIECNKEFEILVFSSSDEVQCPHCNSNNLRRLVSACGFKSSGGFTPSSGSSGCSSCTGGNCSTCR